jgi:hypothetical protein
VTVGEHLELQLVEGNARLPLRGEVVWVKETSRNFGIRLIWRSEEVRQLVGRIIAEGEKI